MPRPRIAAIVLQYGQWQKTADCLESLLGSSLRPAWIIVIDNGSADDSASRLENWLGERMQGRMECAVEATGVSGAFPLSYLMLPVNRGYAAGNNVGIKLAFDWGADAFLIINNDARMQPDALAAMWDRLDSSPRAGICGPLLVYPRSGNPVQCCGGGRTNYVLGLSRFAGADLPLEEAARLPAERIESGLNFICGACCLVSRRFIAEVGLMDEGFFLYCEEQDWALRARGRFDLAYAPGAIVFHDEGATTGWNRYLFHWRPGLRLFSSRLRLAWLHNPWCMPTVAVGCIFAAGRVFLKKLAAAARIGAKKDGT